MISTEGDCTHAYYMVYGFDTNQRSFRTGSLLEPLKTMRA